MVARDDQGNIISSRSLTRMGSLEPTTGEALASYYAACLCKEIGVFSLILEGDAKQVVDAMNSPVCYELKTHVLGAALDTLWTTP